ncbi:unnamed protein product [Bathycoccus prasinos]
MHQEVEFIAEDIEVEVTPNFTSPAQREYTLDVPCNNFFTLMLIADFILRSSKSQTCSALASSELKEAE